MSILICKSLATQAKLLETDRLLELIDQFAEAESRMKWAPNKKHHFEVARIKAIQSLSQVTLNEVIENLNALRDGRDVAADDDRAREKSREGKAGVNDPGYSGRVAESPPQYAAKADAIIDPARIWREVSAKIPPQKGFLRNSASAAHVLGIEGRSFLLGFSPHEESMMEIMGTQANRKFLETLLHEITGKDLTVKLSVKEDMRSEEHTSELQSPCNLVCRLLLEKKK